MINCLTVLLTELLTGWLADWLTVLLIDWLTVLLTNNPLLLLPSCLPVLFSYHDIPSQLHPSQLHLTTPSFTTTGSDASTGKLHLLLSRILEILHNFPGVVLLLCHIDNPQNISLQRDFASRLFCMLKFSAKDTPYEIRAKQWRLLMPSNAPISFHDHMESNTTTVTSTTTSLAGITSTSLTSASGGSGGSGGDINFTELGRRFSDLAPGNIQVPTNDS